MKHAPGWGNESYYLLAEEICEPLAYSYLFPTCNFGYWIFKNYWKVLSSVTLKFFAIFANSLFYAMLVTQQMKSKASQCSFEGLFKSHYSRKTLKKVLKQLSPLKLKAMHINSWAQLKEHQQTGRNFCWSSIHG